jgi:hypothetical protein
LRGKGSAALHRAAIRHGTAESSEVTTSIWRRSPRGHSPLRWSITSRCPSATRIDEHRGSPVRIVTRGAGPCRRITCPP